MNPESPNDDVSPSQLVAINRICSRFENAWREGRRPTIEDHLTDSTEPTRSDLLLELLATELELRGAAGEKPSLGEYRLRFPDHAKVVESAFAWAGRAELPDPSPPADAGRNLLFGLLALQNNFIDRDALLAAFNIWVADKGRPLGDILRERGKLDGSRHALLKALVEEHLKQHDGDPERSLAALSVGESTRNSLNGIGDPGLDASLLQTGAAALGESDVTSSLYAVEMSSSDGRRFRVLRPHASGGLGAVFVALDSELNREVALKQILDRHADDLVNRARFLMEAEITGRLEHPGIVPVYGLGTYHDGRPYYAMRFIRGDSLKDAIAAFHGDPGLKADPGKRSLELRKLLRRFLDVCNAIEYAHSRGVLHRDIKPGNVIVGRYGETLVVDWGLAKPMGHRDPDSTSEEPTLYPSAASVGAVTLPGSTLGTPAYMSPEQAAGELDRLGPRSDVYSLGATLYSLLTGRPAFAGTDLNQIIRRVAQGVFSPPRLIDPTIDRALEQICLKAMQRRPEDRYASPRAIAEDLERWMAEEPVTAWREPLGRRARRWARRNRTVMASAGVALVAAVVGLSALGGVQAWANRELKKANNATTKAKEATEAALDESRKAKSATDAALVESERARERAETVLGFLKYTVLAAARPIGEEGGRGPTVTVREAIDSAEPKIAEILRKQPEVEADVRYTLGTTYYHLGDPLPAIRQLVRALELHREKLGADHSVTLSTATDLAMSYLLAGRHAESIDLLKDTFQRWKSTVGDKHPDTIRSLLGVAVACRSAGRTAESIKAYEEVLKLQISTLGADHVDILGTQSSLAGVYDAVGRTVEAIELLEKALKIQESKLGADHSSTLATRGNLAQAYASLGRLGEAINLNEETLKREESKLGPNHLYTIATRSNLAFNYSMAGRITEAIALKEESLKREESKLGHTHPNTFTSRHNLAVDYSAVGRHADAIKLLEGTLDLPDSRIAPDHPIMLATRTALASAYLAVGRNAEGLKIHEGTVKLWESKLRPDGDHRVVSLQNFVVAYETLGRWGGAEPIRRDLLARRRKSEKPTSAGLGGELSGLALNLLKQSKWAVAEPVLRECLTIREQVSPDVWSTFNTKSQLGWVLMEQRKFAQAEPLVVQGYEGMKAREKVIPPNARPRMIEAEERVVRLYEAWGEPEKLREWKVKVGLNDLPSDVFAPP